MKTKINWCNIHADLVLKGKLAKLTSLQLAKFSRHRIQCQKCKELSDWGFGQQYMMNFMKN